MLTDSEGGHTLTDHGGVSPDATYFAEGAGSAAFSGTGYLSSASADFAPTGAYTVALRLRMATVDNYDLLGKYTNFANGWEIELHYTETYGIHLRLVHCANNGNDWESADYTGVSFSATPFYSVILAYDPAQATEVTIWISSGTGTFGDLADGVAVNMDTAPGVAASDFMIGAGESAYLPFIGNFDDLAFWNGTALSAAQAEAFYNEGN